MANKNYDDFAKELESLLADEVNGREQREQETYRAAMREKRRRREIKRRKRRRRAAVCVVLVFLIAVVTGGVFLYKDSLVYSVCRVEAGGTVTASDFLKKADAEAVFTADSDSIDTSLPGEYHVKIKTGAFTVKSILIVEDTIAPVLELCDVTLAYGESCTASDFVVQLLDYTVATVSFAEEPDFLKTGKQTVSILAVDKGGNTTTKTAQLWLTPVVTSLHAELGSELPDASAFTVNKTVAEYISCNVDMNVVGTYPVHIKTEEEVYEAVLLVEDTMGPELVLQNVSGYTLLEKALEEFIVTVDDKSGVSSLAFEKEPDFSVVGEQLITIIATDCYGNTTEKEAVFCLVADEEAPVFTKADDFIVWLGDTVAYKSKVTVTDNSGADVTIKVDASAVDLKTEGSYPVTYTATDIAGNCAEKTLTVTVKVYRADEEELNNKIDGIFKTLFKDGMTNYEKCKAIYDYIRSHVSYVSSSEKGDYIKAAMEGLTKGKGDCYVYFSLSKAMLTRAGFPNMDIERIRVGDSMHFWNLVDIGDGHGWYHFDATPRVGRPYIFLWDDATLWEYSDSHKGSHNYDKSLYPEIK